MTTMYNFEAVFSTGEVINRDSINNYTHAWYVECGRAGTNRRFSASGFSTSERNAKRNARAALNALTGRREFARICNNTDPVRSADKVEWEARIAAQEATARLEVVATTRTN